MHGALLALLLLLLLLFLISLPIIFVFLRLLRRYLRLRHARDPANVPKIPSDATLPVPLPPRPLPFNLLVVLGSGGHTAEMLTLVSDLLLSPLLLPPPPHPPAAHLTYITTASDTHSAARAARLHRTSPHAAVRAARVSAVVVPRAREVGQPALSSAAACARCMAAAWRVVGRTPPDLVLTNGPATGAVVALAAMLRAPACQVVYVESLARVQTLSVTGRVLYPVADRFLVQWPELQREYPRAEYHGRLC